jgi:hypothetical protein
MTTFQFQINKKDIGKTVAYCPVCSYKRVVEYGAVPVYCPKERIGVLQFIDVTEDLFNDQE